MLSENLKRAYFFHRKPFGWLPAIHPAKGAIALARGDVAAYEAALAANDTKAASKVRRYTSQSSFSKRARGFGWSADQHGLAYVEKPEDFGFREVGRVVPEYRHGNFWDSRGDSGWLTDPYGDVFRDGTGLCYGLVFQLTGRNGKARFVAGYQFGGCDGGPTVDLGTIYEEDSRDLWGSDQNPRNMEAARDAARAADSMAQRAAEDEREYQTAWQAGSRYNDCLDELATIRKSVLATIADMKGACKTIAALPMSIRTRLRQSIESDLDERATLFEKMAKLASGDYDNLGFYPDERLRSAFNEGAGKTVLR